MTNPISSAPYYHPLETYIIPCLLFGESLTILFTIADVIQPDCLKRFRINHRRFPTIQELQSAMPQYIVSVIIILSLGFVGMSTMVRLDIVPYDMNPNLPPFKTSLLQFLVISLSTELLFHILHRYMHANRKAYQTLHFKHHRWTRDSFALCNHDLDPIELIIFSLCPSIPGVVMGVHYKIMFLHAILANWQGTYGHSGYSHPILTVLLFTDSIDHDTHHARPNKNFSGGAMFSIIDRLAGTYM